jgi:hypothetical protein
MLKEVDCKEAKLTNGCDQNDNIDKEPLCYHSNGRPQVPMTLRIDLGRIAERDGEERQSLDTVSHIQNYEKQI